MEEEGRRRSGGGERRMMDDDAWRRWAVLVATVWIQALTGTNFDFSVLVGAQVVAGHLPGGAQLPGHRLRPRQGIRLVLRPRPALHPPPRRPPRRRRAGARRVRPAVRLPRLRQPRRDPIPAGMMYGVSIYCSMQVPLIELVVVEIASLEEESN